MSTGPSAASTSPRRAGAARLRLAGSIWRPAPERAIARAGGSVAVPDRAAAEEALATVEALWNERRARPRNESGLFVGMTYEFGLRLAGLESIRAGGDPQPGLRWFDFEPEEAGPEEPCPADDCGPAGRGGGDPRVATSLGREGHETAVRSIREGIRAGRYYQANLCRGFRVDGAPSPDDVWNALPGPAASPAAAACTWDGGAWLSFSPETFLVGSLGGPVRTVPIKGSRPRGATPEQDRRLAVDLRHSPKDRAELTMIVDLERNDLVKICRPGSVSRAVDLRLEKYSEMMHLVADVDGRLRPEAGFSEMMRAAYPGGSISGAPKRAVLSELERLEPWPRGLFSGALWWLGDDGSFRSSVAIRTIEWRGTTASFGAGGGITWDSEAAAEWEEANAKARPFARALGFEPEEAPC